MDRVGFVDNCFKEQLPELMAKLVLANFTLPLTSSASFHSKNIPSKLVPTGKHIQTETHPDTLSVNLICSVLNFSVCFTNSVRVMKKIVWQAIKMQDKILSVDLNNKAVVKEAEALGSVFFLIIPRQRFSFESLSIERRFYLRDAASNTL